MRRTLALVALTIAVIAPQFSAHAGPPGFLTGPCTYPEGHALPGTGRLREVPTSYDTIQAAVDAAQEGDTVFIHNGTYHESVTVKTPGILITGESRAGVVLDGQNTLDVGILAKADRVMMQNMTAHNYKLHGFHWFEVTGYWGRYLTAYDMGLYGIFAIGSRCGEFAYSYGSGDADSVFYIGECYPCDARIHHVDAEESGLGYSGTNAGGNLILRDSLWTNNGLGIVPNSLDSEQRPPQRGVTISNNVISNNNNLTAPATGIQAQFWGVGIAIAGGQSNSIYGNTITDNGMSGIVLVPLPSTNVWIPGGNTIWGNTVKHDAVKYPDSIDLGQGAASGPNNCWADNNADAVTAPPAPLLTTVWSCDTTVTPPGGDPRVELALIEGEAGLNGRAPAPWQTWPAPTCAAHPNACEDAPTGPITQWLPALGL